MTTDPGAPARLASLWSPDYRTESLGSIGETVHRVTDASGEPVGALRVTAADGVDDAAVAAEVRLLTRLGENLPDLRFPTLLPGADGELVQRDGGLTGRLMRWVPGARLADWSRLTDRCAHELGSLSGRIASALGEIDEPLLHRANPWDPRRSLDVVAQYTPRAAPGVRELLAAAVLRLSAELPDAGSTDLPWQLLHLDITDFNVLGRFDRRGGFRAVGVIDFEDMTSTWRACELAVSAHAAIGRRPEDPHGALRPVLDGYFEQASLTQDEAELVWPLVLARAATCAAIESVESAADPGNAHTARIAEIDVRALQSVLAADAGPARALVRRAAGFAVTSSPVPRPSPDDVTRVVAGRGRGTYQAEAPLTDEQRDLVAPPAMMLGTVVHLEEPSDVVAPFDAVVHGVTGAGVLLRGTGSPATYLRIEGFEHDLAADAAVSRGERIGRAAGRADEPLHVQLLADPGTPSTGAVRDAWLWRELSPDPSAFLPAGVQVHDGLRDRRQVLADRQRHVAAAQKLYFRDPPLMVSGQGQWMVDDTGRRYLDLVNNVAVLGHSHPRVTAAAVEQMQRLSTNSRFLYDAIGDYADRVVATLPPELDTVLFVNSGSEAVELALQIARAHTGRHDVVVVDGTYHGWTSELVELGTLEGDRPHWRERLAPWVHVAAAPDAFRGLHGDDVDACVATLEHCCTAAAAHGGPAAFLIEPVSGSRGGVVPPAGYLQRAFEVVRQHGGVVIADEVQVGFARTGDSFWSFEPHGVVPDVLAAAKAVGNGHPLGFVVTRHELAEAFAARYAFFSTPGGNPVSCRIGTAVLEVIADEGLQDNARRVGARIRTGLTELAHTHPVIGAVYGLGFYQGVDLVDPDARDHSPLPAEAVADICERLLELGCIVQPTGLLGNVLKVKPPLCITEADATRYLAQLDRALTEWAELDRLARVSGEPSPTHDDRKVRR